MFSLNYTTWNLQSDRSKQICNVTRLTDSSDNLEWQVFWQNHITEYSSCQPERELQPAISYCCVDYWHMCTRDLLMHVARTHSPTYLGVFVHTLILFLVDFESLFIINYYYYLIIIIIINPYLFILVETWGICNWFFFLNK